MNDYDGQIQVEHRCFALAPDPAMINQMFGSPEAGKAEILTHWASAAAHPGGEAINVELMRSRSFTNNADIIGSHLELYPTFCGIRQKNKRGEHYLLLLSYTLTNVLGLGKKYHLLFGLSSNKNH